MMKIKSNATAMLFIRQSIDYKADEIFYAVDEL